MHLNIAVDLNVKSKNVFKDLQESVYNLQHLAKRERLCYLHFFKITQLSLVSIVLMGFPILYYILDMEKFIDTLETFLSQTLNKWCS